MLHLVLDTKTTHRYAGIQGANQDFQIEYSCCKGSAKVYMVTSQDKTSLQMFTRKQTHVEIFLHTNTHGYVGKHLTYKEVCMVDDGLEKS